MPNRFYTLMIVPEKTDQVKKIVVPAWLLRSSAIGFAFLTLLAIMMTVDYWYVMGQISENKQLKLDNRKLKQQVQIFKSKMNTIEGTIERVKTFTTRLKVITNVEDRGGLLHSLNAPIPDASINTGTTGTTAPPSPSESIVAVPSGTQPNNDEDEAMKIEYQQLESRFGELNKDALYVEQVLQDQYEQLADQKAFLAALPTRKPAVGYFTSGFGIRKAPIGGRVKMHEGLDIANRPGTVIRAPADGTVVYADGKAGYGQTLILDHGYGLETWYGHTRKIFVRKGAAVRRGDQIALLGNSGRSTGPHLHYEVRVHGTPVDPLTYILEN